MLKMLMLVNIQCVPEDELLIEDTLETSGGFPAPSLASLDAEVALKNKMQA